MSTRLYLATPTSYSALVDPDNVNFTASWVDHPVHTLLNLATSPSVINTPENTYANTVTLSSGVTRNVMVARFITPPLAAGTYNPAIKSILRAATMDSRVIALSQMSVRLVGPDGRAKPGMANDGLLLPTHASTPTTYGASTSWTGGNGATLYPSLAGAPNRAKFPLNYTGTGTALTAFVAEDGDRLVIEIGARVKASFSGSAQILLRWGSLTGGTDYPETVGANTNTPVGNGWIEFSQTLNFLPEPRAVTLRLDSSVNAPATLTDLSSPGFADPWAVSGVFTSLSGGLTSHYTDHYSAASSARAYTSVFPAGTKTVEFMIEHPGGAVGMRLLDFNASGADGIFITDEDTVSVLGETFADIFLGAPHHIVATLTGDGYLDLYVNGFFVDRRSTSYEAFPGGDAWLHGAPAITPLTATVFQAFTSSPGWLSAGEAVELYRNTIYGGRSVALDFSELSGNFLNSGSAPGTSFVPVGSWSRGTTPLVSGYSKSSKSDALGAYIEGSGVPTTAKSMDLLFQTDPSSTQTELIALSAGGAGNLYLQISAFDSISLFYNGVLLAQSANFAYYDGGPTYVQINLDGAGGGDLCVGEDPLDTPVTWASGGPTTLTTTGAVRINGYANSPGTSRYQDQDIYYQAFNVYPLAATTALDRNARYVLTAGWLAEASVSMTAVVNGASGINVSVTVGSLAKVTLVRIVGALDSTPEILYKDRTFNGEFVYVDTTVPFDTVVTYRVTAVFLASSSSSTYQITMPAVGAPSPDEGSCYPAYLNDPQDPNFVPLGATLQLLYPMAYDARTGVFDIVGEAAPVAINSSRGTPKYTMTVLTHTEEGSSRMRALMGTGRPVYLRVPTEARPDRSEWFASVQTLTENQVILDDVENPLRKWEMEIIEVQRPNTASGLSSPNTWAGVRANNASCITLAARAGSWFNVVNDTNIGSVPG